MKKIITSLLILTAINANAQFSAFKPGVVADGVNYALPRTGITMDVTVRKVTYTPGDFARYADRFLHITNVQQTASTEWNINGISLQQCAEPDSLKYFTVKMKDKTVAPMAQLTDDGVIVAINNTVDLPEAKEFKKYTSDNRLDSKKYLTADILAATSIAKMAELTAQEILDIRDSKNAIKRGQVESMPKDGPSLKIVLDELNLQENALMQLFIGYRDTTITTETFKVVPEGDIKDEVVFRFSKKLGFVDADDLAGEPYYISIQNQNTVPQPTELEQKKRKIAGIVYNMPSLANVTLRNATSTIYEKELPFGQFGTIDVLSSTLFGKDSTTKVTFNPLTGGLLHIEK